jgi:threonine dehydratase
VSEEEIAEAIWFCLKQQNIIVEGGGAVGVAALLTKKVQKLGAKIAIVLSGGNLSLQVLKMLIPDGDSAK